MKRLILITLCLFASTLWMYSAEINKYKDGQVYYTYMPERMKKHSEVKLLIVIHGYSARKDVRKVKRDIERWESFADLNEFAVLAPHFEEKMFNNDYQRLNLFGEVKCDVRLEELKRELKKKFPKLNIKASYFYGSGGGGQFVHRYAMFYPERIIKAVARAPSWYTFPDELRPYPVGLSSLPKGYSFNPSSFKDTRLLLIVDRNHPKETDVRQNYMDYNLDVLQGAGRTSRAKNWYKSAFKYSKNISLQIVGADTRYDVAKEYFLSN